MHRSNPDVIVVGNGAVGASIAFELVRRGHQVVRVGSRLRPFAASGAAGAMLGCFGEVTKSLLASPGGRAKLSTDYRARGLWPRWEGELSEASGIHLPLVAAEGTSVVLNTMGTAAVDSGNFQAIVDALEEYDEPFEFVDPEQLDWFDPDDLARSLRALHIPNEHAVDAHRLLEKLDAAFEKLGGTLVDEEAQGAASLDGRGVEVRLASGAVLSAGHVVVAAGARSLRLLSGFDELRRIPPMVSGYGVSALFEIKDGSLPTAVLRSPNRAFACGIHCVPRGDGVLYVGGTNVLFEQPRRHATVRDLQFLLECAVDQLYRRLPEAGVLAIQVGNRPVPADGFPLIGPAGPEGVWLATGTYRDGLHQSPLIAGHLAALLEGGEGTVEEILPFTPVRRPLPTGVRAEVVESTVEQALAAGYEQRWRVTPEWPRRIEAQLRREFSDAVEALHPEFTPPAEFIPKLDDGLNGLLSEYYRAWS